MRTESELRVLIAQAYTAYDRLLKGEAATELTVGDQTTRFSKADPDKLLAYIRQLEAELAAVLGGPAVRGAIGVVF